MLDDLSSRGRGAFAVPQNRQEGSVRAMDLNLNDLLQQEDIGPQEVLVFRHRPVEPKLNKYLPSIADERPDLFNAYQATQSPKVEKAMTGAKYVASFTHDGRS